MQPNILFILIDGLRADQFFGKNKRSHTPFFDSTIIASRPGSSSVEAIFSYELPGFIKTPFKPNIFENIEKEFPSKIRAIKCYKNELMEYPHPRSAEALEMIAKRWGTVAGFNFAEAFNLVRNLKK